MPANNQIPTTTDIINALNNGTLIYAPGKSGLGGDMNFCWRWQDFKYWINNNGVVSPNDVKLITWGEIIANKITFSYSMSTSPSPINAQSDSNYYAIINVTDMVGITTINFTATADGSAYVDFADVNVGQPGSITQVQNINASKISFVLTVPAGTTSTSFTVYGTTGIQFNLNVTGTVNGVNTTKTVTVFPYGVG